MVNGSNNKYDPPRWLLTAAATSIQHAATAFLVAIALTTASPVMAQQPSPSRPATMTKAASAPAQSERLYYYKGKHRVEVHLDLTQVAIEGATVPQISRLTTRANVSATTTPSSPGKAFLNVNTRSRADLTSSAQRLQRSAPGASLQAVLHRADAQQADNAAALFVTNQISFKPAPGKSLDSLIAMYKLSNVAPVSYAPGSYTATVSTADDLLAPLTTANQMQESGDAEWASPLVEEQKRPRAYWNDPLLPHQWHLQNTGTNVVRGVSGNDISALPAWDIATGAGVNVAINDDGVQWTHPDLLENMRAAISYDFNDNDADPMPAAADYHGTACAGVAAGRGNNSIGISGVAPEAGIGGLRLLGAAATDAQEGASLAWKASELLPANQVFISSNSWGPNDDGSTLQGGGPLTEAAIEYGVRNGRNGKGIVYVWAAGNGRTSLDNINKDGYASNPRVIAVGSTNAQGTYAYYSEPGAPMLVNAPGGEFDVVTTDLVGQPGRSLDDYYRTFSGTSAAAPIAAGVVALMLQANPSLTFRDVMHILVHTATQNHPESASWTTNGAGLHFSHDYGFGRVNALAAVQAAQTWSNVPAEQTITLSNIISSPTIIPDGNSGAILRAVPVSVDPNFRVEHVELQADITHPLRGDVMIYLQSPDGTISELIKDSNDYSANFSNWRFRSVAHWGENPNGEWRIMFTDNWAEEVGTVNSCTLRIQGHIQPQTGVSNWNLY